MGSVGKLREGEIFLAKTTELLSSFCCHTERVKSNPLGEITLELNLVFQIPESGLTINSLIGGLKKSAGHVQGVVLESLMQADI
jgi:hypothetical protein